MKNFFNKTIYQILLGVVVILVIYSECRLSGENQRLAASHGITSGRIIDFGKAGGRTGDDPAIYIFEVKGKQYKGKLNRNKLCYFPNGKDEDELKKSYIPIVYDTSNPTISRMLVKKGDYAKYHVRYPDSIKVTLDKYFGCTSLFFGS